MNQRMLCGNALRSRGWLRALQLESLEDRRTLSTIQVTTELDVVNAGDGLTSLREAVTQANASAGIDTIRFSSSRLRQGRRKASQAAPGKGPQVRQPFRRRHRHLLPRYCRTGVDPRRQGSQTRTGQVASSD